LAVATTLSNVVREINNADAKQFLSLFAFLDPEEILADFLKAPIDVLHEPLTYP
jgi:hypothetical protein